LKSKHLHIISFNVPYPPDYGGVIDVFNKIKALHAEGIKIHLHCFEYGRNEAPELNAFCEHVYYYPRLPMWRGFFSRKPFLIASRKSNALRNRLLADEHPILFEGLHACYLLDDPAFQNRIKLVRMHNNEPVYYKTLANRENRMFKKTYFLTEASRLSRFESVLSHAQHILCISPYEADHYEIRFPQTTYISAFHGHEAIHSKPGKGSFVLYHGNLSVNENDEAVKFILKEIWKELNVPLVIAGSAPSEILVRLIKEYPQVKLVQDPDHNTLEELIRNAHIHLLPAMQQTGIKLKLLNAIFNGRFCIANRNMIEHTGLEQYCLCFNHADEAKAAINAYMQQEFTAEDVIFRQPVVDTFSDSASAKKIISYLPEHP